MLLGCKSCNNFTHVKIGWFKLSNTRVRILVVCISLGSYLFHVDFQVYMNIGWQSNPSVFKLQWLFLLFHFLFSLSLWSSFLHQASLWLVCFEKRDFNLLFCFVSHSFLLLSFVFCCCFFFSCSFSLGFLFDFLRPYFNSFIFIRLFLHINVFMAVNLPRITAISIPHIFWYVVFHSHSL